VVTKSEQAGSEEARWIDAVTRMIELTQSEELRWEMGDNSAPGRGDPTTPPYHATYKSRTYRLQGRWVEAVSNPFMPTVLRQLAGQPRDREAIALDIVDHEGRSLYRVPNVSPVRDLLKAVQRQTADPNAAIRDLLDQREESHEKPLNRMLLEMNEKVPDAVYSDDNTGANRVIEEIRAELEADPEGGPLVVAEADDMGVWSLTTLEEGYSSGLVGTVYEDTGEGEPR